MYICTERFRESKQSWARRMCVRILSTNTLTTPALRLYPETGKPVFHPQRREGCGARRPAQAGKDAKPTRTLFRIARFQAALAKVQASDSRAKSGLKILLLACACACACVRHLSAKAVSYALHARPPWGDRTRPREARNPRMQYERMQNSGSRASYGAAGSGPR